MKFDELIQIRHSCRKFQDKPVEREKIIRCLESARLAPSACNSQPWKFLIFDDQVKRPDIAIAASSGIYSASRFIQTAPVLITVLADKKGFLSTAGSFLRNTRFYLIDIGIACEHIVLQAAELGLGTCYVGWFNEKAVIKVLDLKKNIEIPLIIVMGYPAASYMETDAVRKYAVSNRRKSIEEITEFNKNK